jgi:hypothetical protein
MRPNPLIATLTAMSFSCSAWEKMPLHNGGTGKNPADLNRLAPETLGQSGNRLGRGRHGAAQG